MLIRPRGPKCYFQTDAKLDSVTLCYVNKFKYLRHIFLQNALKIRMMQIRLDDNMPVVTYR